MTTSWRREAPLIVLIAAMFVAAAVLWPSAPARLPVHWNIAGQVDRYGGKFEGLLGLPLAMLGLYVMFLVLPLIDPKRTNYASFAAAYDTLRWATLVLLAAVYAAILLTSFGYPVDIGFVVPVGVGLLFCLIGNLMSKFRQNWFVGVRTPWTLSSRASWDKTNRLGGRMFLVTGLVLFALALVHTWWMDALLGAMIVAMVVWLPTYSYLIWRRDPERQASQDGPAKA